MNYELSVCCYICGGSGGPSEMHRTAGGLTTNCHEACYQSAPADERAKIDGLDGKPAKRVTGRLTKSP